MREENKEMLEKNNGKAAIGRSPSAAYHPGIQYFSSFSIIMSDEDVVVNKNKAHRKDKRMRMY